jgi:hypothetical protein
MSSTVDRRAFAARLMSYKVTAEVFMPIRIRRLAKTLPELPGVVSERVMAFATAASLACYTDTKPKLRSLCGSI